MADLQGNDEPQSSEGTESPSGSPQASQQPAEAAKALTSEEMNRAITARLREYQKKSEAGFAKLLDDFAGKLKEQLTPPQAAPATPAAAPDKTGADPEKEALLAELAAMRSEVTSIKSQATKLANEAKAEKQARADLKMRNQVSEHLASIGITGARAKHALGFLVDVTKVVTLSESGEPQFFDVDSDEPLSLEQGIKKWSQSEDAKIYLPPRGAAGSGSERQLNGASAGRGNAPNDPRSAALAALSQKFRLGS